MWDIQTFMDDLKSDANEVRKAILANPELSNIERKVDELADYYVSQPDAPMNVDPAKLRAAYIEHMMELSRIELLFMCRIEAAATAKQVAA